MRFYNQAHKFYCGIDLHARTMYLCILDQAGGIVLHQEIPCEPATFLEAIAPFREGLVVACECLLAGRVARPEVLRRAWCSCRPSAPGQFH